MKELSDRELLDLFAQPDSKNQAFSLLVKQYQQRLYWHIRKMVIDHDDADDLLQNTFMKAYQALENFREDSKIFTWLYRIATNESITFLNQKKRKVSTDLMKAVEKEGLNTQENPLVSGDRIQMKLQQALLTLPDKQRLVFNMKYFENMKYDEISAILGTSVGALKASYHLAVKKIEDFIRTH
jgi:RNA polymerase sigma-70 factor (ECF subfamily)